MTDHQQAAIEAVKGELDSQEAMQCTRGWEEYLMIFGFNRFVNSTLDVSYPAFLSIFAAPLISAFIHVPSDD